MVTRSELHLNSAKAKALESIQRGEFRKAILTFNKDLEGHPDLVHHPCIRESISIIIRGGFLEEHDTLEFLSGIEI